MARNFESFALKAFCPIPEAQGVVGHTLHNNGPIVTNIDMVCDGVGPMGYYDMIHITFEGEDKPTLSYPAHQCHSWEFA